MVKLGSIVESVVFYTLGNVIPDTTLSGCTKTSREGMYKVSDSCVSFCWKMNALKVLWHLITLGWAIKLPTERLVTNVLSCWEVITDEYAVMLLFFYSTFTVIVYPKIN